MLNHKLVALATVAGLALAGSATAQDLHIQPVKDYVAANIEHWVNDPVIIAALKKQNEVHAALSADDIDRLDKEWRAQTSADKKPLIDELLGRELSKFLQTKRNKAEGVITELFVMDNKGLNVGQSDVTSDYWQGDEAKWLKSYGAGAVFVDDVEMDESSQALQSQASLGIVDPETGEPLGAITVGINIDLL